MLVRERHAPAMADAAESAVERQPARVNPRRGRPVSGERPSTGGSRGRVSERQRCQRRLGRARRDVVLAPPSLETGSRVAASRRARSVRVHRRRRASRSRLLPAPAAALCARASQPDVPHRVAQDGGADGHRDVASRGGGERARAAAAPRRARRGEGGEETRRVGGWRARRGGTCRQVPRRDPRAAQAREDRLARFARRDESIPLLLLGRRRRRVRLRDVIDQRADGDEERRAPRSSPPPPPPPPSPSPSRHEERGGEAA
mmetsp:Transcript_10755/g.43348  ORF Transcript_10755/g.43348 Transcript_10755/m.43348 type:complete len:260 (-) Transcript_10755:167-946(-)